MGSSSGWTVDYPYVEPDPAPFTIIAWRMLDISDGNTIYWEHAFGAGGLQNTDLVPTATPRGNAETLQTRTELGQGPPAAPATREYPAEPELREVGTGAADALTLQLRHKRSRVRAARSASTSAMTRQSVSSS